MTSDQHHAPLADLFLLDRSITHLNHGAFGATPRPVFESLLAWQRKIEDSPAVIVSREHDNDRLLADVRATVADFAGCDPANLALVQNTTVGVAAVARAIDLRPGDEVLASDDEYLSRDLLWDEVCNRAGARYVRQSIAIGAESHDAMADVFWSRVSPRTRVIYMSHITSNTAVRLPVEQICLRARKAGILTVVDGAQAPGQLAINLEELGAGVYAASCHKWLCGPRGTGFLYVHPDHQAEIWQTDSAGSAAPGAAFEQRHRWQGTLDPSPLLALPEAIRLYDLPDWKDGLRDCHELARAARSSIAELFGLEPLTPDSTKFFGQMVATRIPEVDETAMRDRLFGRHRIDIPVRKWNGQTLLRVSFHVYNNDGDLDRLLEALNVEFGGNKRL